MGLLVLADLAVRRHNTLGREGVERVGNADCNTAGWTGRIVSTSPLPLKSNPAKEAGDREKQDQQRAEGELRAGHGLGPNWRKDHHA